jgi:hypothetical protein
MELAGGFGLTEAPALPGRIEESFIRRLDTLSEPTRRLLLVAAADPAGDPQLLIRAWNGSPSPSRPLTRNATSCSLSDSA